MLSYFKRTSVAKNLAENLGLAVEKQIMANRREIGIWKLVVLYHMKTDK